MKYAYNDNGTLRDVVSLHPSKVFIPGYAELFIEVPDDAENGWTWHGTAWGPKTVSFTELKADKLAKVQAEKVKARDGGFMVAGTLFDSDISARTSYTELGLRLSQNPSFETQWKASPGQWVLMDAALYSQVVIAGEAHIAAVFAWQAAKEQEIGACETVEELEAVDVVYS